MKPEEMTHKQLVSYVKEQWKDIDDLTTRLNQLESRWKNTNSLLLSYINEFADRKMIYIPKEPK